MSLKLIAFTITEKQADELGKKAAEWVQSEEFQEDLASKINKKIDIPFVSEDKEQIFFEKCVDLVADIIEGLFESK